MLFRVLIYPKESIDELIRRNSLFKAVLIHVVFGLLIWAAITMGPDKSQDLAWYFLSALFGHWTIAGVSSLSLSFLTAVFLYLMARRKGGKGSYIDVFIAYSYGLVPMYTGLLFSALIPSVLWRLMFVYVLWTCVLTVRLLAYVMEVKIAQSIRFFLIGHAVITIFGYIPSIYLIMLYNSVS